MEILLRYDWVHDGKALLIRDNHAVNESADSSATHRESAE
jgi:hypothetical protein